ncbi:MAG: hypothetical protein RIB98_07070 [Acidimicrobiales bacterium]
MPSADPFRILVVCTANICRSVMAERFLVRDVEQRGLAGVAVSSCGLLFDGEPASDTVLSVLAESSLDAADHRSRVVTPELVNGADLIVTMERAHAREITMATEGDSTNIHTLGALVDWLRTQEELDGSPDRRVRAFAEQRRPSDLLGSGTDEVEDPHGRSKRLHRKAAARIEDLCTGLLDGLYGGTPQQVGSPER